MKCEYCIKKAAKGIGHDLIWGTIPKHSSLSWEKPRITQYTRSAVNVPNPGHPERNLCYRNVGWASLLSLIGPTCETSSFNCELPAVRNELNKIRWFDLRVYGGRGDASNCATRVLTLVIHYSTKLQGLPPKELVQCKSVVHWFIHSLRSLSYDRTIAPSKASSPQRAV
jgi:hypothetical protein